MRYRDTEIHLLIRKQRHSWPMSCRQPRYSKGSDRRRYRYRCEGKRGEEVGGDNDADSGGGEEEADRDRGARDNEEGEGADSHSEAAS